MMFYVDEQGTTDSVRVWHAVGDMHDTIRLVATFHREHHPDPHGAARAEADRLGAGYSNVERMARLVLDFGGDECFCPINAHDTGNYCEVCELRELARTFAP